MTETVSMIGNVRVFDINLEEHDKHVAVTLEKIKRAGFILMKEKRRFSNYRITFLGQIIDGSGVHPDLDKVSAIMNIGITKK